MKRIALLMFVLLMFAGLPMAAGHNPLTLNFRYVDLKVNGSNSTVEVFVNSSLYFQLSFEKIYFGSLNLMEFPRFWYASLDHMNVENLSGYNGIMGNYVHVRMWKHVNLTQFGWGRSYSADISIDIYISAKNYTKKSFQVNRNTLRYDVSIKTDCPSDFVYLAHRIKSGWNNSNAFYSTDHHWRDLNRTMGKRWMNFTDYGRIGFGSSKTNLSILYMWDADGVRSMYSYWDDCMELFFVYKNTGNIVQDPYLKLPVPIFTNASSAAGEVVNYFMEHTLSVGIGLGVAVAIISIPVLLRRRLSQF